LIAAVSIAWSLPFRTVTRVVNAGELLDRITLEI
jgi:hypothetical protein